MSTEAKLRPARAGDLDAIESLLVASQLPVDGVADSLSDFVVAESGHRLVGVAGLEVCCEHALLRSVAVDAEWRSRGIGRELVTRVIADAESRGVRALYLLTTSAENYFPTFGFKAVARSDVPADIQATEQFRTVCCATATVMCRECESGT